MDVLTTTQRRFKLAAGILGLIQSLAYIILASISIGLHVALPVNSWQLDFEPKYFMYELFIDDKYQYFDHTMNPGVFCFFMVLYVILNFNWAVVSTLVTCQQRKKVRVFLKLWSIITWLVCGLDFITVAILGADYNKCIQRSFSRSISVDINHLVEDLDKFVCRDGILPVLVLAAKGFVLWIINFALAFILFRISNSPSKFPFPQPTGPTYPNVQVLAVPQPPPVIQNYDQSSVLPFLVNPQNWSGYPPTLPNDQRPDPHLGLSQSQRPSWSGHPPSSPPPSATYHNQMTRVSHAQYRAQRAGAGAPPPPSPRRHHY